jgi:hypothetical protein
MLMTDIFIARQELEARLMSSAELISVTRKIGLPSRFSQSEWNGQVKVF